ncbi:uncharacterized protein LOC124666659 [Lolium rigidum]|uniref:uncharacterized protein LOC124666659 n=1 Tax=Lolium rigidum TaxID=89674 RepID=UPI001F5C17B0|nr:uncharacterized protein LOC124666659 [Lolium rigidum]
MTPCGFLGFTVVKITFHAYIINLTSLPFFQLKLGWGVIYNDLERTIVYRGALGGRGARESLYMEFCSRAGLEVRPAMVGRDGDLCPRVGAATRARMACGHRSQGQLASMCRRVLEMPRPQG